MHKTYISSLINYYALSTRSSPFRRRDRIFLHVHSQAQPLLTPQNQTQSWFFCIHFLFSLQFSTQICISKHRDFILPFDCCVNGINHTVVRPLASFLLIPFLEYLEAGCFRLFVLVLVHVVLLTYLPGYLCWCGGQCFFFFSGNFSSGNFISRRKLRTVLCFLLSEEFHFFMSHA